MDWFGERRFPNKQQRAHQRLGCMIDAVRGCSPRMEVGFRDEVMKRRLMRQHQERYDIAFRSQIGFGVKTAAQVCDVGIWPKIDLCKKVAIVSDLLRRSRSHHV